jgi:hypothetical protein
MLENGLKELRFFLLNYLIEITLNLIKYKQKKYTEI